MLEETTPTIDLHQNLHRLIGPATVLLTNLLFQASLYRWNPGAYITERILEMGGKLTTVIMPPPGVRVLNGSLVGLEDLELSLFQQETNYTDLGTQEIVEANGTDSLAITDIHRYVEACHTGVPGNNNLLSTLSDGTIHSRVAPIHDQCDVLEANPFVTLHNEPGGTLHFRAIQLSSEELNRFGIPHVVEDTMLGGLPEIVEPLVGSAKLQVSAALLSVVAGAIGAGVSRIHYEIQKKKQGN